MHGDKVMSRYHIADPITFRNKLDIDFENYCPISQVQSSACIFFYIEAENLEENSSRSYDLNNRNKYFSWWNK